ncbi:hypothetical protein [Skermania piniformis]|uniref:Integral membrane protein n=1 Tax=Skermania pinensis TaxID=39122 RepID=A0ABX8SEX3_9ACTN|nr:hypothetical protein [Skermania piniformis]QXQ14970.1 hypothetical protein KV203_06290 [Skermania piniformis]
MTTRPPRQRVVLGRRRGARLVRTRVEVTEQTAVGAALVDGLVRAQLALAVRSAIVAVGLLGAIPLLTALVPGLPTANVLGVRLVWLLLGGVAFILLYLVGRRYVQAAERIEREFTSLVGE